jgi:hypothetical protein
LTFHNGSSKNSFNEDYCEEFLIEMSCGLVKVNQYFEEFITYVFKVKEQSKQETGMKQVANSARLALQH